MGNAKLVFCGCHESGYHVVVSLLRACVKIDYIVTLSEELAHKNNVSGYRSFQEFGDNHGISIYYASKYSLNSAEDLSFFQSHSFDLLIQGGWQRLFPEKILSTLRVGAVGVHGSMDFLPYGRGRSPINWSIIEGRNRFIFQYFIIKPGIDDGDIFHHEMVDINMWDDCSTIYLKNSIVTQRVLTKFIPRLLTDDFTTTEQIGTPTYFAKRTPEMGRIDWSLDLFELHDFIRALTKPYPGSFAIHEKRRVYFWKAQPFDTRIDVSEFRIGEVVFVDSHKRLVIKVLGGLLLVSEYQSPSLIVVGSQFN